MRTSLHFCLIAFFSAFYISISAQANFKLMSKWDYARKQNLHEKINKIIPSTHGYVVAVGETLSKNRQNTDGLFLVIRASDGSEVMRKQFDRGSNETFHSVIQNHNGTFSMVGSADGGKKAGKDAWVLLVDWHGNKLSEDVLDSKDHLDDELLDIAINKAGVAIAIGTQKDKKSKKIWGINLATKNSAPFYITSPGLAECTAITAMADGNFAVLGNTSKSYSAHPEDAWIVKIGTDGSDLWAGPKFYGDKGIQEGQDIIATKDGGLAFVGANNTKSAGLADHWVVKLDPRGAKQWERNYGRFAADAGGAITELSVGGYAILGQTRSYMQRANTSMLELTLIGPNGQQIDTETYPTYGPKGNEMASAITEVFTGDLIISGNSIQEKDLISTQYIGAISYRPLVRQPNSVDNKVAADVDGSKMSGQQSVKLSAARFIDANGNNLLEAAERGYVELQVQNTSNTAISNLSSTINADNQSGELDFYKNLYIGTLAPGESTQLRVPVYAKGGLSKEAYQMDIRLDGAAGPMAQTTATLQSSGKATPARLILITSQFIPGENPPPGTPIILKVDVQNAGGMTSQATTLDFSLPPGVSSNNSERQQIPSLLPRGKHTVSFSFTYNENYSNNHIPIRMEAKGTPLLKTLSLAVINRAVAKNPSSTTAAGSIPDEMVWASHDPNQYRSRAVDVNKGEVDVKVVALSKAPLEKRNFNLLINGKKTKGQKNFGEEELTPPPGGPGRNQQTYSSKVALSPGRNEVEIVYQRPDGSYFKSRPIIFNYTPKDQPSLYVLSIGVEHEDLKYTVKDAEDIYRAFDRMRGERGFKKVRVFPLTTKETTTQRNIQRAFVDLTREGIKENDLVVVFISSHGKVSQRGKYILLPSDFESAYEEETAIDFKADILNKLDMVNANVLVLIDACQSGSAYGRRSMFGNEQSSAFMNKLINNTSGLEIIASCADREFSYEDDQWRNGAFTKAILEAFSNKKVAIKDGKTIQADIYNELEIGNRRFGPDGIITIEELRTFIGERVPYLVRQVKNKDQNPSHKSTERLEKSMGIYMIGQNN